MLTFYVAVKLLSEVLIFKNTLGTHDDLGSKLSFMVLLLMMKQIVQNFEIYWKCSFSRML